MDIAKWRDIWRRFAGHGVYPSELAFLLDTPLRRLIISPRRLADTLHLGSDAQVLEIGPGPGYFSVEVARRLTHGRLVLFDIQTEMLVKSWRKLERAGLTNCGYVQGGAMCLPFGPCTFDTVFMVTVLGEVAQPEACLSGLSLIVRPGGLLSITEMRGDPDALSQSDLRRMVESRGFEAVEHRALRGGFTLNFRRK